MRHSVHMMFGRVSSETLLDLKQYVLKYGAKEAASYFTALHVDKSGNTLVIEEAVPAFSDADDVPFEDSFRVRYETRASIDIDRLDSLKNYLIGLKNSLVNTDHPGDFAELHYCMYLPLFDPQYWEMAKLFTDVINTDVYPKPQVDIVGFCADMAEVFFPDMDEKSYDSFVDTTCKVLKSLCDYNKKTGAILHIITIDNKQSSGVALKLNSQTLIRILGEFSLLVLEKYSVLLNSLLDDKDLCAMGLATMSIDRFYFIEYLLRKAYLHVLDREQVKVSEVDYNKMSQLSESILSKWVHLMSDFFTKEVTPRRQLKKDDQTIVVEITPLLSQQFAQFVSEVDDKIREDSLSIPEKRAFLAVLLGFDDASLVNDLFNEDQLIINDLEREAIQVFIDANNSLLGREETKDSALLSVFLHKNQTEEPVSYPLDHIKKNRIAIKHCVGTIRELQKNEDKLKSQLANQIESEKCLIKNGVITFKGNSFKLLPSVVDPPLQEQYEPHPVKSTSIDLRSNFTTVRSQGSLGSCLSHALVSIYEYFLRCNGLNSPDLSELFLYYNARSIDGKVSEDTGSTILASMKALSEQGICLEQNWPYDESRFDQRPPESAYSDAATRKVKTSLNVALKVEDIKSALEDGFPVAISINVFESFTTGMGGFIPIPSLEERQSEEHGCHAMVICGYSEDEKVFIVRNSWGMDFGDSGYCYMPYSYVTNPDLTNWAAIIKEIATAQEVTGGTSTVVNNGVFTIKPEKRAHVNFDHSDASIMLMETQAGLAEQQALLEALLADDRDAQEYYAKLKQQLIDKNLQNRLKDATVNRFNLDIADKKEERQKTEKEKFSELEAFDKKTIRQIVIGILVILLVTLASFFVNKALKRAFEKKNAVEVVEQVTGSEIQRPKFMSRVLIGDAVLLAVLGLFYYFRCRSRKELEDEYNDKIERLGVQIAKLEGEREITRVKFFMSGFILTNLFDLSDKLSERYNILKSFQNNLITWYGILEEEDPNKDRGSHPTSVTLMTPEILDAFFEMKKDDITEGLRLSDFLNGFVLSEDGLVRLKKALERAIIDKIATSLDDFSIYRYLAKEQDYPYLPKVTNEHFINAKLEELDRKAMLFQQFKVNAGAINPQSCIFIHIEDSELNKWSTIYPNSFSIRPISSTIESKAKIAVTKFAQMNLADVLFYKEPK